MVADHPLAGTGVSVGEFADKPEIEMRIVLTNPALP